jgi:hydrogenase nickel incorporation protein HypB
MCATCGCSRDASIYLAAATPGAASGGATTPGPASAGAAPPGASARAARAAIDYRLRHPANASPHRIDLEADVLAHNDALAARNRAWFAARGIVALNLVSSPGSGKTSLLVRTARELGSSIELSVLGGDQATANDTERIAATGCRALQINTGTGCHLDAQMVARGVEAMAPPAGSLLMIENVGNLVCPALFDLGERAKVVLLSTTEGEDKPLKYPHMFRASALMVLTKTDLLPHLDFDVDAAIACARRINPDIAILQLSSKTGQGMDDWYEWLRSHVGAGALADA